MRVSKLISDTEKQLSLENSNRHFEAVWMVRKLFSLTGNHVLLDVEIDLDEAKKEALRRWIEKRNQGYPLQYLFGEWDFFGRTFLVGEGVLIPRSETEILVETVLSYIKGRPAPKLLDLCSGSGCIAVTLALERRDASVTAVELSSDALKCLTKNDQLHQSGVRIISGDALRLSLEEKWDAIVSNPPYLTKEEMDHLQTEVTYEPKMALYGEEDGLFFYRRLTQIWKTRLKPGGMLAFEVGDHQGDSVARILRENGFSKVCQTADYHGIIRVVTGIWR